VARVFDAVARLLRAWGERQPAVLAIDDLHVADVDTLTLLALLMRHLQDAPLTFLATMRAHAPDVSVDLASAIERLARDGVATVIELGPLDIEDVRAVARGVLPGNPDDRLVDALWSASKGNPFYVEEGSRSLTAAGQLVVEDGACRLAEPDVLPTLTGRSSLLYRLYNLGPDARAVARVLTAFRRVRVDQLELVAELTGLEPDAVDAAFDTLVEAHVLRVSDDGYDFVHPIVRVTLYDDLGPAERRRVHGAIAAHLVAERAAGRPVAAADLATHVSASAVPGDLDAVAMLEDAARTAASSAPASSAVWWGRAAELLPADDPRRGELYAELSRAAYLASQHATAAEAGEVALQLLPAGRLRSRTAGLLVTTLAALGRFDDALEQADAILAASDEPLPRLLAERGTLLAHLHRFADAEAAGARALELAGDDGTARVLAIGALAAAAHAQGNVARFLDLIADQEAAGEDLGPAARLGVATMKASYLATSGFADDAAAAIDDAAPLRAALGGAALREPLDVAATITCYLQGRWDEALELTRWLMLPPRSYEPSVALARNVDLVIRVARGDFAGARATAADMEGERYAPSGAKWGRAVLHEALGDYDAAVELLEEAWAHDLERGRRAELHVVLGSLVDIELARDDTEAARRWAKSAVDVFDDAASPWARVVRSRIVGAADGNLASAQAAVTLADEVGLVVEGAHARRVLGVLGEDPATHLRAAYETYRELGAESWRRRAAQAMKAAGIDVPRRRPAKYGDLSETEVRLARLVHDGLTNREIAHTLFISPKTVEVYLSRLFAKVGCSSRLELAVAVSEGRIPDLADG
jgi:DNA-binding CsgD family transcriptional regulator